MDDISLPKSTVTRLAKASASASINAPGPVLMQKDASTALQKSAVVFLNYIATNANDITLKAGRKVISPADMIQSIERDFPSFGPRMHQELEAYNFFLQEKKANKAEGAGITADGDDEKIREKDSDDSHIVKKIKLHIGQTGTGSDSEHGFDALSSNDGADAETIDDIDHEIYIDNDNDNDKNNFEQNEDGQPKSSHRHVQTASDGSASLHYSRIPEYTERD